MGAIKYLIGIIGLVTIAKGFNVSYDAVLLGYCVLTAGWIVYKE